MKKCLVYLPVAGMACVRVEADTKQEAMREAMNKFSLDDIESFDCYAYEITTPDGNTLMASVEVEE